MDLLIRCTVRGASLEHVGEFVGVGFTGSAHPGADLDWDYLEERANLEGVLPVVASRLTSVSQYVPDEVMHRFRRRFAANRSRNRRLASELRSVVVLLQESDVAVVPIKGPVLAVAAYGSTALRQFGDLDLLVRESDVSTASGILLECGYGSRQRTALGTARFLRETHAISFRRDDGAAIDLHWRFTPPRLPMRPDMNGVWSRIGSLRMDGAEVPSLQDCDTILMLCLNAYKDCWLGLKASADVAAMIESSPDLPWAQLVAEAERWGARRALALGLRLAVERHQAPVPTPVRDALWPDDRVLALTRQIQAGFYGEQPAGYQPRNLSKRARFHLLGADRLRDGIPYLSWLLRRVTEPNDRDRRAIKLPAAAAGLYYLVRPFRLLPKYLARAVTSTGARVGRALGAWSTRR